LGYGNGDHGKGSDADIHAHAGFSSGEDKICADTYVTISRIENLEFTQVFVTQRLRTMNYHLNLAWINGEGTGNQCMRI
jgi:hypothetical protein